jgi:hypothetical protein
MVNGSAVKVIAALRRGEQVTLPERSQRTSERRRPTLLLSLQSRRPIAGLRGKKLK